MKKVVILTSYIYFSLASASYAQDLTPIVKDINGENLFYCKNYSMKIGNKVIKLGFNQQNNAYYLSKNNEAQKEHKTFQIKPYGSNLKKCDDPVAVNDLISIEFIYMNKNNMFLTYQNPNNGIDNPYYNSKEDKLTSYSLQESFKKDGAAYKLINSSDNTILYCMNNASCTSIEMTDIDASKIVFEPTSKNEEPNKTNQQENLSTEDLLNKLNIKIKEELNRWNEQAQHVGNYSREELLIIRDQIKEQVQILTNEFEKIGEKNPELLQHLNTESEKILQKIQNEYDRIERQVKEEADRIANQVKEEADRAAQRAREEYERNERQIKEEADRIANQISNPFDW